MVQGSRYASDVNNCVARVVQHSPFQFHAYAYTVLRPCLFDLLLRERKWLTSQVGRSV